MKRRSLLAALGLTGLTLLSLVSYGCDPTMVIYAQSLPITKTVAWDANAASDNVTSYTLRLDTGTPSTVVPPATTGTVTFTTAGTHTITVTATNVWGTSPPATLVVNVVVPGAPGNVRIQ